MGGRHRAMVPCQIAAEPGSGRGNPVSLAAREACDGVSSTLTRSPSTGEARMAVMGSSGMRSPAADAGGSGMWSSMGSSSSQGC